MKTYELVFATRSDNTIGPDFHKRTIQAKNIAEAKRIGRSMEAPQDRVWFRGDMTREEGGA